MHTSIMGALGVAARVIWLNTIHQAATATEQREEEKSKRERERERESFRKIHSHELKITMMSPVGCLLSLTGRRSLCPFEARTPYFLQLTKMTGSDEFQPIKSLLELLRSSKKQDSRLFTTPKPSSKGSFSCYHK